MRKLLMVVALLLLLSLSLPVPALAADFPGANWATYFTYTYECPDGGPITADLIAGQHYDVGSVRVWNEGDMLYVEYIINVPDIYILEAHVAVEGSLSEIDQKNGNPIPGKFDYKAYYQPPEANPAPFEIDLEDYDCGAVLYIATHAALSNGETAWGDEGDEPQWPEISTIAFEDKEIELSDFDYNDWTAGLSTFLTFSESNLTQVDFEVIPESRGAGYNHAFHILIPANTFASDGTYLYTLYDGNGDTISSASGPFDADVDEDYVVIPDTYEALPGSLTNTIEPEGVVSHYPTIGNTNPSAPSHEPYVSANRTAELSITFDPSFIFNIGAYDPTQVHGEGLFFDPYLEVITTGEDIHQGDPRMITIPVDWVWPEAAVGIWMAYPLVDAPDFVGDVPEFPANWWSSWVEQGTPTTDDDLIYNGP